MNKDILQGKWGQIKGKIQKQWGKLTDDDLTKIKGDTTKLKGILQEKYGYTKQEAEKMYDNVFKKGNSFIDKVNMKKDEIINREGSIMDKIPGNEYLTDEEIIAKRNEEIATYRQKDRFEDRYFERQGNHRTGAELTPEDYENLDHHKLTNEEIISSEDYRLDYLEDRELYDETTEKTHDVESELTHDEMELNAKRIADKYYHEDSPDHDEIYGERGDYTMTKDRKNTDKYYHDDTPENRRVTHKEDVVEHELNRDSQDVVYDSDVVENKDVRDNLDRVGTVEDNLYEKDNLVNPDEYPTTDEQEVDAELVASREKMDREGLGESIDHIHEEDYMVNPDEFPTSTLEQEGAERFAERAEIENDLYGNVDADIHIDRRDVEEGVYDRSQYTEKNLVDRGIYKEDDSDLIANRSEVEGQPLYKEDGSNRPNRGEVDQGNLPIEGDEKFHQEEAEKTTEEFYREEANATQYIDLDNKLK